MIGDAINRIDAARKVTGRAVYTYERRDAGDPLYGVILGAAIGKGRIRRIDVLRAERAPGVHLVMTHENAPEQGQLDMNVRPASARSRPVLSSEHVSYFGESVALVVATTFEQARAAAALIAVDYDEEQGAYDLASNRERAYAPAVANVGLPTDSAFGDLEGAIAAGPVSVDRIYTTPYHLGQPMEPHACVASWEGDHLRVYFSTQVVAQSTMAIAGTLRIPESNVHVDAAFVGGGFGAKLNTHAEAIFAALAARQLQRPVKVTLTRRQMFTLVGHRPESIQRVRLSATREGRLTGLGHEVTMQSTAREEFVEQTAAATRSLYAAPNRLTRHRLANLDLIQGEAVRGPGEVPALLAFESAMDELAHELGIDPVELRIRNDTSIDPEKGVPLAGRRLSDCIREGARRFGWDRRPDQPATRREGSFLIGYGMASAIRMHFQTPTKANVRIEEGRVIVSSDMTDIGTGTYTILAQVASEVLGVPLDRITVALARSEFPRSLGSGGSYGASNTSVALYRACEALKQKVADAARTGAETLHLLDAAGRHFPGGVEADGELVGQLDDPNYQNFSQSTYGATFAEVGVDVATGEVRLRRMLGVFAAGRIINPKTARSQLIGGMIWGVSSALHEAAHIDPRYGQYVNGDLAEYLIPVHADIPAIDAVMLDDFDERANPLGIKGVGELGVCGSGASVANAVFNATGIRVRDFPITLDKLLPGLPQDEPTMSLVER
jgi:xanthine dehydrogenase YagR molybdenum-binding subunit